MNAHILARQSRPRDPLVIRAARRLARGERTIEKPSRPTAAAGGASLPPPVAIDRLRLAAAGIPLPGGTRNPCAEEARALRAALRPKLAEARDWRDRVLMVTSARPHEGKTFTALALALALAADHDHRVMLLDADPARCGASRLLGLPSAPGLAELLADVPVDPAEALRRTDIGITCLPPGGGGTDFPDRLAERRTGALFAGMLEADPGLVIVIDAPPVLASSEVLSLLAWTGTVLFVVEAGVTPRREVERAVALLRQRVEVALVLNRASGDSGYARYGTEYHHDVSPPVRRGGLASRLFGWSPLTLLLAAAIAVPPLVAVARLDLTPRLELATAFTDNVRFAPEGEKDPALVGSIGFGLELAAGSSRAQAAADYGAAALHTLTGEGGSELRQRFDGGLGIELVRDLLFLDAAGSIGEEGVNRPGDARIPSFALADERTTRYFAELSPSVRGRLGEALALELRYRLASLRYDDPALADATSQGVGLVLSAPREERTAGWGMRAQADRIDIGRSRDEPARVVQSRLVAVDGEVAPREGLVLSGGLGWSQLEDETLAGGEASGPYARLGARLETVHGIRLSGSYGRLFGEPDMEVELALALGPSTRFVASYRERLVDRVTLVRERIAARNPLAPLRNTGRPPADPQFRELVPELDLDLGTSATFHQRLLELVLERTRGRDLLRGTVYAEGRRFDDPAEADERRLGAEAGWLRRLSERSEAQLLLEAQRIDFDRGGRLHELALELGISHRLSRHTRFGLGYELALRQSDGPEDVVSNTIFAQLTREF